MTEGSDPPKFGTLIDGLHVSTELAPRSLTDWVAYVVKTIAAAFFTHTILPEMNVVVRREGQPGLLYLEGPYAAKLADQRVVELVVHIEQVGAEEFIRDRRPPLD
jgi:hypothetical protein